MVPRLWPESTIVCIGSGPSLTASDLALVYDAVHDPARNTKAIAVNSAVVFAPWADAIFGDSQKWWRWHPDVYDLQGLKFCFKPAFDPRVTALEWSTGVGLDLDPTRVRSGGSSGYAAINLAVHLGARRIVQLGYDMCPSPDGRHHAGDEHPDGSHLQYEFWRSIYQTLLKPMDELGISLVNASRRTAIPDIPRVSLEAALAGIPCYQ